MKNYRVVNRRRFIMIVIILMMVAAAPVTFIKAFANTENDNISIVVNEGDTLWEISKNYMPKDQDIRKSIYEIEKLNDLNSCNIKPGQVLMIPTR